MRRSQNPCKKSHIFDELYNASLIALCQLYDDDCIAILDKNKSNILEDSKLILKGHRNKKDRLWYIPILKPLRCQDHSIITRYKTKTYLIQYLYVCLFSPTPRTFMKAIKMVTSSLGQASTINNCFKKQPPRVATALGHMDQEHSIKSELEIG